MVVVEERGNPAGLRQAPRERRRRRGRAAPRGEVLMCYGQPHASIYIGENRAAPPLGFPPPQGVRPALDGTWGGGQEGREGRRPLGGPQGPSGLGFAPSHSPLRLGPLVGGAPAHLGAGTLPHLAHAAFWGRWPHLVDPRDPPGGPGTLPISSETFLVTKTGLPIYKSLPPDHSGTPRDVRDLIRDSEQHSVTTYKLPL